MILITGAFGMLGTYLCQQFAEHSPLTLGRRKESDFIYDLSKQVPDFGGRSFHTVIHAAGTEDPLIAFPLNLEGTRNLVQALEKNPPRNFVFISSYRVYSRDAGENVDEDANTWASDDVGRSKAQAEKFLIEWASRHNITLTLIRPARMFGNGVGGDTLSLFNDALSGKYIHIRGNDAKVSLVTAYDVARAVRKIYDKGGIYNAADGSNPTFIGMVEAMTANAGAKKRMTYLPLRWAEWVWRIFRFIPSIQRNLSPDVVEARMKTLTIDGSRLAREADIKYHDTIAVMEHQDSGYPYSYLENNTSKPIAHEV